MKEVFIINSYFKHLFKSKSKFKIHSPFIYDLITNVFNAKVPDEVTEKVMKKRKKLYSNKTVLEIVDFGAGSISKTRTKNKSKSKSKSKSKKKYDATYKAEFKTVKKIAKAALLKQKYVNLIYNLINHFQPKTIVELGTSLGITTSAMALARPCGKIFSLEGCASTASIAQENFKKLGIKNVKLNLGEFDTVLPEVIKKLDTVDFVFFDGNHRKEATISYFEKFLPLKTNETVFVFDDIHWSKGMEKAWEYIKDHPETVVTIDLFQMGIVFFRKELSPQHIVYRF